MAGRHWLKSALVAATSVSLCAATDPLAAQTVLPSQPRVAPENNADAVQRDLEQQERILRDPAAGQAQREEAARKLVSREADGILLRVLTDLGNRESQLYVARALASDATPNPIFVKPLSDLLGQDQSLTEAAAQALTLFRGNRDALQHLVVFVTNLRTPLNPKRVAVKAMGRLVDKTVAQTLIDLLNDPNENSLVRDAAAEAMEQMTGLSFGTDPQRWNQWWDVARRQPDSEWANDLLRRIAARANDFEARMQQFRDGFKRSVQEQLRAAPAEADKARILLSHLNSESQDVRAVAVDVIHDELYAARPIPPQIYDALRGMVGDSAPQVRQRVALTLGAVNDPNAFEALLTQAAQERNPDVLTAIIAAIGPASQLRGDLRAVDTLLLTSLNQESFSVSRAAAESLKELAKTLREPRNAELAARVAAQLHARLRDTERNVAAARLRESIVESLAQLAHPTSRPVFASLLNVREPANVRIWALRGMGAIGDHGDADAIVNVLKSDRDKGVRLAAANALLTTATYEHSNAVAGQLREEIDPNVREKIWEVMASLFEKATAADLPNWVEYFKVPNNAPPEVATELLNRRLTVLTTYEKKLIAGSAAGAGPASELATTRQNLGDTLLTLGRAEEASLKYMEALRHWNTQNVPESVTRGLIVALMRSLLQAKKDVEAASFATEAIAKNQGAISDMWVEIKGEINRRRGKGEFDSAQSLVEQAKKIPLGDLYAGQLGVLEKEVQKDKAGGRVWVRQPKILEHASMRGPAA